LLKIANQLYDEEEEESVVKCQVSSSNNTTSLSLRSKGRQKTQTVPGGISKIIFF
jgi:hypothetical protein